MNLLTDKLPLKVLIDGEERELNTDFRNVLLYFRALRDKELNEREKLSLALTLFFKTAPRNAKAAIDYINDEYLLCGKQIKHIGSKNIETKFRETKFRAFCFDKDSGLIFAAFYQQYGINLERERMHWYVFKGLFDGLTESTYFKQIVNFRQTDIKDIPKDKRAAFLEAKRALSVEEEDGGRVRTAKEIERELLGKLNLQA
jgi:hypothetical protein